MIFHADLAGIVALVALAGSGVSATIALVFWAGRVTQKVEFHGDEIRDTKARVGRIEDVVFQTAAMKGDI